MTNAKISQMVDIALKQNEPISTVIIGCIDEIERTLAVRVARALCDMSDLYRDIQQDEKQTYRLAEVYGASFLNDPELEQRFDQNIEGIREDIDHKYNELEREDREAINCFRELINLGVARGLMDGSSMDEDQAKVYAYALCKTRTNEIQRSYLLRLLEEGILECNTDVEFNEAVFDEKEENLFHIMKKLRNFHDSPLNDRLKGIFDRVMTKGDWIRRKNDLKHATDADLTKIESIDGHDDDEIPF